VGVVFQIFPLTVAVIVEGTQTAAPLNNVSVWVFFSTHTETLKPADTPTQIRKTVAHKNATKSTTDHSGRVKKCFTTNRPL
jgi:hypothetical protein